MSSPTTRPVLAGVDGLPGSAGAVRYAVDQARERHAPLQLVHVVSCPLSLGPPISLTDLLETGRACLARELATVRETAPDLDVTTVLARGDRSAGLVQAAESAQLLVIGRETRRGLDRLLTGTTTASVASHAPCDVVVVPSFWVGDHPHGRVVVALKSRRDSRELLAKAFAEAGTRRAALRVVTAWELADPYLDRIEFRTHADEWVTNATQVVLDVTADWRAVYPDVDVEAKVVHGSAATVLLQASGDADLLVISRRRFALPPYGHLGGVGHSVLRLSDVPVHVVPYAADDAADEPVVLELAGVPVN
jgi:nucleotide-binding universal stress UspA family protein